jgi:hypothetical protein
MEQKLLTNLKECIPKSGIVFNEKNEFSEILCKPKLLPLKTMNIKKLEKLEKEFEDANNKLNIKNK